MCLKKIILKLKFKIKVENTFPKLFRNKQKHKNQLQSQSCEQKRSYFDF